MDNCLKGKNVLITGTNRGIGKQLVLSFASNGANIIAHSRKKNEAFSEFVSAVSRKHCVDVIPMHFDLLNEKEVTDNIKLIYKKKISVDVLVNNAGVSHGGLFQMTSIDSIKSVFEVNFFAQMLITQLVLRGMVHKKKGAIINIASISGIDLDIGNCAYGASKAALIAFTKTISKEVGGMGIRVNAIAPGLVDTDMSTLMEKKALNDMISNSVMHRLGRVDEVANLVCFLASDQASFINGQIIRCDGGKQ